MSATHGKSSAKARGWKALAAVVAAGLVAAACGGGSKKSTSSTTSAGAEESTTTTVAPGSTETTVGGSTTTAGGATATTAKKTTTTAKKKSSVTAAPSKGVTQINVGIGNVTSSPTTAPPPNFQPGGTITYAKTGDIGSIDPVKVTNSGASDGFLADAVYDLLLYTDVQSGKIVPQTADSLPSTDAQVWTLKLRPGIKFSDGTAYDADAVKFNYQRIAD